MPDRVTAFAPGRVNLIGEHTDYNQGLALPFAIRPGVTVRATRAPTHAIEAIAADLGERDHFDARTPEPASGWRAFVRGAAAELARAGVEVPGSRIEITGSIPQGAGLSSSAALSVALVLALLTLAGQSAPQPLELARLCSAIENDWVGAHTGLLDQLAVLLGAENQAVAIDFRATETSPVPVHLDGHRLVILDSGQRHDHAGSGYNERRAECVEACSQLGIGSLRDASRDAIARLPPPLARRAQHVIDENRRVLRAVAALQRDDPAALGPLLDESHASLRDLFEVSTPAIEATVCRLHEAGALGARLIGGGFGGHVLGLFPPETDPPSAAVEVRPSAGAHIKHAGR